MNIPKGLTRRYEVYTTKYYFMGGHFAATISTAVEVSEEQYTCITTP